MRDSFIIPDYIQDLLEASNDGLDGITSKLSHLLSVPVIITDPLYKIISDSLSHSDRKTIEMNRSEAVTQNRDDHYFTCTVSYLNEKKEAIGTIITTDNQESGYLFVLLGEKTTEGFEIYHSLLKYAALLCSCHVRKEKAIRQERLKLKEAFLFDLLYGNFKKKIDIIPYGEIWGWELSQPHLVVVFSIIDYEYYSTDKPLINTLLYVIETMLFERNIKPITLMKRNEIIAILPATEVTELQDKQKTIQLVSTMLKQTTKTNLANRVTCGIGKIYENPEELFRSYQEAKVAYELGLLLNIPIPFFSDLGLERVLYKHDLQDLKEFYDHVLGKLLQYDEQNGGDFMHTLENFAQHQFDLKKTSEALFLHRNTLRYRLNKIEEILEQKLDDFYTRLNIVASLKIKQLHKL
ncbi:PucR family transcriptional regulator [Calidifontibacillus oryziterrae]|uniref:PucR family transcriptional regulator n=1 Tax=Calidifontibacillus oryziterrae TaxID=1191699 RepID=UPI000302BE8F|nr:helix-turn-helix domain-containing protein [Calidifontibacillus oryziterrae]